MAHKRSPEAMRAMKEKRSARRQLAKDKVVTRMKVLQEFLNSEEFMSLGDLPGLSNMEKEEVQELFHYSRVKVINSVQEVIDQDLSTVYQVRSWISVF